MSHLRLVAGTDVSNMPDIATGDELSEAAVSRIEEQAREALRSLKLPGQDKTLGELRDELARRCRKRPARSVRQRAMYDRLDKLLDSTGIYLCPVQPDTRSWDIEFRFFVGWPDELVAAHPEFKPYMFVLEDLQF